MASLCACICNTFGDHWKHSGMQNYLITLHFTCLRMLEGTFFRNRCLHDNRQLMSILFKKNWLKDEVHFATWSHRSYLHWLRKSWLPSVLQYSRNQVKLNFKKVYPPSRYNTKHFAFLRCMMKFYGFTMCMLFAILLVTQWPLKTPQRRTVLRLNFCSRGVFISHFFHLRN